MKDLVEGEANGLERSRGGLSEQMLELGEDLLDGVEVRGVFGQEEQLGARRADQLARGFAFVAAEIVHDDDIAGTQGREENLFEIEPEAVAIDRALEQPWRLDAIVTQRRQESHGLPAAVWNLANEPLATRRPPSQGSHIGPGPGLVDEDKPLRINAFLMLYPLRSPVRDVGTFPFASRHAFF